GEDVQPRHEWSVGIDPDEIAHAAFGNEPSDLVGGIAVRIDKNAAVALADVANEEVHECGGLADAGHALNVNVAGVVDDDVLAGDFVGADGDFHFLKWAIRRGRMSALNPGIARSKKRLRVRRPRPHASADHAPRGREGGTDPAPS